MSKESLSLQMRGTYRNVSRERCPGVGLYWGGVLVGLLGLTGCHAVFTTSHSSRQTVACGPELREQLCEARERDDRHEVMLEHVLERLDEVFDLVVEREFRDENGEEGHDE